MLFVLIAPSVFILGSVLVVIGVTCLGSSFVVLNSFLPVLVANDPSIQEVKDGGDEMSNFQSNSNSGVGDDADWNAWDEEDSENEGRRDEPLAGVMKVILELCMLYISNLTLVQPGITFFGEKLCDSFDNLLYADRDEVDLLLIIGTSLKVCDI